MVSGEKWLPLPGHGGFYEVSNCGRVRLSERLVPSAHGVVKISAQILLRREWHDGYLVVSLRKGGEEKRLYVHRLVALCFCLNFVGLWDDSDGYQVRHIDGDKYNNVPSNLEYAVVGGDRRYACGAWGSLDGSLAESDIHEIRRRRALGETQHEIAEAFGVWRSRIGDIATGRRHRTALTE